MGIVAKYKFDGSVYADLIPEFNAEFTDYTITDEVDSENSNHIIRTIESDSLPTMMRFGSNLETYVEGSELALLEVLDLNTSELTSCHRMFMYCKNLTSITCNWDTSNVTNTRSMFDNCNNLTTLDVSNFDTANVDDMLEMFSFCKNLTSIDVSNFNTSKVTTMAYMFRNCHNLASLDVNNFDTSKVTRVDYMFQNCRLLSSVDLSNFDTSQVTTMNNMFDGCTNLITLDVSNFNTSNATNMSSMFNNTPLLTDIGMIYCDQSTINKVASLLPTDHNITIWVESDDILQYDQYDHITYKTQKVQDTVHLNSPLLKGDTIEVIDGKTYHVHRWEKIVLDGSEDEGWWKDELTAKYTDNSFIMTAKQSDMQDGTNAFYDIFDIGVTDNLPTKRMNSEIYDNNKLDMNCYSSGWRQHFICLKNISSLEAAKQWLSENPTTVIYKLAIPHYELISEEPLELTLLDTTDNTINNNSILPSNMTIANKELSTIAIKPSTIYTLSFDKSNVDSEVTIDICGGEQITTVLNRIELTTPSELGSGIRFISSDGCIVSNVRLLEGSLVEGVIPKETFEGLKNSFEDGYIIGENLVPIGVNYQSDVTSKATQLKKTIPAGTTMTIIIHTKQACKSCVRACLQLQDKDGAGTQTTYVGAVNNPDFAINTGYHVSTVRTLTHDLSYINVWFNQVEGIVEYDEIYILEGDHTHLSEAELMRYIEKGTSHYEEEDYNHAGKYKVQYKVTGKNKFNLASKFKHIANNYDMITYVSPSSILLSGIGYVTMVTSVGLSSLLKEGVTYTMSLSGFDNLHCGIGYDNVHSTSKITTFTYDGKQNIFIWFQGVQDTTYNTTITFQLEEGTVATEYEPYKEDIKTYYLSSPLLEGDTIEDVNGVATHVKRYEKVVLDGSENWFAYDKAWGSKLTGTKYNMYLYSDTLVRGIVDPTLFKESSYSIACLQDDYIYISLDGNTAIEQWLQANPTTVVYQLASPQYEKISTESILCDSYVNGHLDFDSAVPIEKVIFKLTPDILNNYLLPSTLYTLKFDSDNSGIIDVLYLGGRTVQNNILVKKGVNTISFTLPNTLYNNKLHFEGIGFNISNIQVVATDRDIEFGYFKGLQSSFEDGLVTDETDENYGKYKVECKIVGKNLFDGELEYGRYNYINGIKDANDNTSYMRFPKLIPIKNGSVRATVFGIDGDVWFVVYNTNGGYIDFGKAYDLSRFDGRVGYISFYMVQPSFADNWYIQIEEGTQATSYEPYKESIHTLYLNSPLLKGDKLVVHDGKLCHYHKMGMVMLDGSEDEYWSKAGKYIPFSVIRNVGLKPSGNLGHSITSEKIYNNALQPNVITSKDEADSGKGIYVVGSGEYNEIRIRLTDNDTVNSVKQWLQQNPTTVVYELAEPYYEPIEPQLSQYSFSTVKDGDMEIITVLPIEKINLTYRTDINGVSSIEEQIASIQEGTDISSIIDEEVDE